MGNGGVEVPCLVCGSAATERCWERAWRHRAVVGGDDFRPNADAFGLTIGPVRRCCACSHRFVELPDQYADGVAYEGVEGDEDEAARAGALLTYRLRCERLLAAGVGPNLLEVGCWDGAHFPVYTEHGFVPTGIEPSTWAVARATAEGHDVRVGTLGTAPLADVPDGGFDAVVAFDVIEHVADPRAVLAAAVGQVRSGGHLVLTTPRSNSVVARVLGARWWSVMPMHVQFFSDASTRALLGREPRLGAPQLSLEPKAFPFSYYADRLQRFLHLPGTHVSPDGRLGRRVVAPNFRDRLWIDVVVQGRR